MCDGFGRMDDKPCPICNGEGVLAVNECPREMVGQDIASAINLAGLAIRGHLPESGGTLDQDAWFMSVWSVFEGDKNKIDEERRKRS